MIYFLIPLRSKAASNNWQNVCNCFERTLDSCYNQTSKDFKVIIVCHDIPNLTKEYDDNLVRFISLNTPTPSNSLEMMTDKIQKIYYGMQTIRSLIEQEHKCRSFIFPVDADDLISNRIASFFERVRDENICYLSRFGYIWYEGSSFLSVAKHLYRTCGSCCIVNYNIEELPSNRDTFQNDSSKFYLFMNSHRELPLIAMRKGKVLRTLPFPSTVYILGTGENHSIFYGKPISWKRCLERWLRIPRFITRNKAKEFNILSKDLK